MGFSSWPILIFKLHERILSLEDTLCDLSLALGKILEPVTFEESKLCRKFNTRLTQQPFLLPLYN